MKIFITGASGFVGSFVFKKLVQDTSHEVAILLRNPQAAWRIADLINEVIVIKGDLSNPRSYSQELVDFCPDIVLHLAWGGVGNSNRNSLNQWKNVSDLMCLIETLTPLNISAFIGLGSQAEYGPINKKIDETYPENPTTLYGVAKLAALKLAEAQLKEMDIRFAWLRLFSSYGPSDEPTWLLQYLINQFLQNISPQVTKGEQLWDYIYIEDVADAVLAMVNCEQAKGVFNLGSGQAHSLKHIIEKTRDLINPNIEIQFGAIPYRPDQVMHLEADIGLLKNVVGWEPKFSLEEGLIKTVNWAKNTYEKGNN